MGSFGVNVKIVFRTTNPGIALCFVVAAHDEDFLNIIRKVWIQFDGQSNVCQRTEADEADLIRILCMDYPTLW